MPKPYIAIVDYCAGNLRSVTRAFDFLQLPNKIVSKPAELLAAAAVVIPGVGAAGSAMAALRATQLDTALTEYLAAERPYLGICLGFQILFERSAEDDAECLGVFAGSVESLQPSETAKVPHIGWNSVDFIDPVELMAGIDSGTPFYHVHSYYCAPTDTSLVVATTTHGATTFPAITKRGQIWGVQFHPEKSGQVGLTVLQNFAQLAELA